MTDDRTCIRGCTQPGTHYAACEDYGRTDGACTGCVLVEARDGALVCRNCYGRLARRLEQTPALIEHLRERIHGTSAKRLDRERVSGSATHTTAPTSVEILDACRDIMPAIYAPPTRTDDPPAAWRAAAAEGIAAILDDLDAIANDAAAFSQWWDLVMAHEIPGHDDYWTISRALARWPIEDRRHPAKSPCVACDHRSVFVTPPSTPGARTWYACHWDGCGWSANDEEEQGLYGIIFETLTDPSSCPMRDKPRPAAQPGNPLLTREEAAEFVGSTRTLSRWQKKGLVTPAQITADTGIAMFWQADLVQARDSIKIGRPPKPRPSNTPGSPNDNRLHTGHLAGRPRARRQHFEGARPRTTACRMRRTACSTTC